MKYESKAIKLYHDLMMFSCVLVAIGGTVLAFTSSRQYHEFSYLYGGYYETNMAILIAYLLTTALVTAIDYAFCKASCECFNNVYIMANKVNAQDKEEKETFEKNVETVEVEAAVIDIVASAEGNKMEE